MTTFDVVRAGDAHYHFRHGEMIGRIIEATMRQFRWAIAMGNVDPLVTNAERVKAYRREIESHIPSDVDFHPLMTVMLTPESTPEGIEEAFLAGAVAVKWLPAGKTHNAHRGLTIADIPKVWPVFERMQKIGMKLLIHAEHPGEHVYCLRREQRMLPIGELIACAFPWLQIVFEHISSAETVQTVLAYSNIWATISATHLTFTTNDVLSGMLMPDRYCNPIVKDFTDRLALRWAATSGDPSFMFGSDDAAHDPTKKYGPMGCPGTYNGPITLPMLIAQFEEAKCLDRLNPFLLRSTAFYDQPLPTKSVTFIREPYLVPNQYNGLTPGLAGQTIDWWYA